MFPSVVDLYGSRLHELGFDLKEVNEMSEEFKQRIFDSKQEPESVSPQNVVDIAE